MDDYTDVISNQPVVIDNGSGMIKAGFAGEDVPKACFPSIVGTPKHTRVMAGAVDGDSFIGARADELRGILKLSYPTSHGIVEDWDAMERIFDFVYRHELKVPSEEHPVLLTEAPLNPRANREKLAEIMFESFNAPAFFVSMQAVLSLYASGRTTGVVLDSGDGVSHAVPIYEGFALPHAISRIDIAGRDVTEYLQRLLRRGGHVFSTSAEMEVVRLIKEASCYVAYNPAKEEALELDKSNAPHAFKLPDGKVIFIGAERFRAPEILFHPSLIGSEYPGVHQCLMDAINKADLDLRRTLFSQVVLSGGSTLFAGYGDRLLNELRRLAPKDTRIRISAPPERRYSVWIGASILASLATFRKMWITADEYREDGANAIHRKCF